MPFKVHVKFFASVREAAGFPEDEVELNEGATLLDLIDLLVERYGVELKNQLIDSSGNKPSPHIQYLIDGENSRQRGGYGIKIQPGSEIAILPPVGGGTS